MTDSAIPVRTHRWLVWPFALLASFALHVAIVTMGPTPTPQPNLLVPLSSQGVGAGDAPTSLAPVISSPTPVIVLEPEPGQRDANEKASLGPLEESEVKSWPDPKSLPVPLSERRAMNAAGGTAAKAPAVAQARTLGHDRSPVVLETRPVRVMPRTGANDPSTRLGPGSRSVPQPPAQRREFLAGGSARGVGDRGISQADNAATGSSAAGAGSAATGGSTGAG